MTSESHNTSTRLRKSQRPGPPYPPRSRGRLVRVGSVQCDDCGSCVHQRASPLPFALSTIRRRHRRFTIPRRTRFGWRFSPSGAAATPDLHTTEAVLSSIVAVAQHHCSLHFNHASGMWCDVPASTSPAPQVRPTSEQFSLRTEVRLLSPRFHQRCLSHYGQAFTWSWIFSVTLHTFPFTLCLPKPARALPSTVRNRLKPTLPAAEAA